MTLSCYYFYALNNYHIGTLSFDILLVTLFLMCVSNVHGDFLSLDSLRRGSPRTYNRLRPYFLQRLLQLQLAWSFWYTALAKISAGGNWLTDKPYYYLMHYPSIGVVRDFPLRTWLGQHPSLCHGLGIALIAFEFTIPFLWMIPRTRAVGITLGVAFQLMLWITLHVPTIFLFLFPPMMLLFIQPERLVRWIETRQATQALRGRAILLYDGQCGFCLESVKRLRILDLFGWVDPLDFHVQPDLAKLHPALTPERCRSEMVLLEPNGRLSGGFQAFARLTRRLPLLMGFAPLVHLPGSSWVGTRVYRWVAAHRYLLHRHAMCQTNQCAVREAGNGSSKI
jgi:predicted DCC family thiol-disulfide oxidoreductase YuxK